MSNSPLRAKKPRSGRPPSGLAPTRAVLFRLYSEEGKSVRDIAQALSLSKDMVARSLKAYGIEARTKLRRSRLRTYDREALEAAVKQRGVRGMALELGVNASTLSRFLRSKGKK